MISSPRGEKISFLDDVLLDRDPTMQERRGFACSQGVSGLFVCKDISAAPDVRVTRWYRDANWVGDRGRIGASTHGRCLDQRVSRAIMYCTRAPPRHCREPCSRT